jgi:hypothetical protein
MNQLPILLKHQVLLKDKSLMGYWSLDGNAFDYSSRLANILTQYDGTAEDLYNYGTSSKRAQGFKVNANETIGGIAIRGCRGASASGTTFTVEIWEAGANPTAGTLIYSEVFSDTILGAYTATPGFVDIEFSKATVLSGGSTQYYLVIYANNGHATDELRWSQDVSASYALGSVWTYTTSWAETAGNDCNFKVFAPRSFFKNNGTVTGATKTPFKSTYSQNSLGYKFDGTDDDIIVSSYGFANTAWSAFFILTPSAEQANATYRTPFRWDDGTANNGPIYFYISGYGADNKSVRISVQMSDNTYFAETFTYKFNANKEYRIWIVVGTTNFKMYINGKLVRTYEYGATKTPYTAPTGSTLCFGNRGYSTDEAYAGLMKEVAIFGRAVSSKDIYDFENWMNGALPRKNWLGIFTNVLYQAIVDGVTYADTVTKKITGKKIIETSTNTDIINKLISKIKTETSTWSDVLSKTKVMLKLFVESFFVSDVLTKKQTGKSIFENASYSETLDNKKTIGRSFIESEIYSDVLNTIKTIKRSVSESITYSDIISRVYNMGRMFTETVVHKEFFYGKINGVNIKYFKKYAEEIGSYTKKYIEKAGTYIKKYFDI